MKNIIKKGLQLLNPLKHFKAPIKGEVLNICVALKRAGGRPFLVGGCVRDMVIGGIASKDIDIEVFGLNSKEIVKCLEQFGSVDVVGESFGVIKLTTATNDFDISLPRTERKSGLGHKGFEVTPDPHMSEKEAASRRDFTFNALMMNPFTGELLDFFGGVKHLEKGIIQHTSEAFAEDPLRVLRAAQFAARFGLTISDSTVKLAGSLRSEFSTISKERIWTEFEKLILKGAVLSKGIDVLHRTGWLSLFEGFSHETNVATLKDNLFISSTLVGRSKGTQRLMLNLAVMTIGHKDAGKAFLTQIDAPKSIRNAVVEMVKCFQFVQRKLTDSPRITREMIEIILKVAANVKFKVDTDLFGKLIVSCLDAPLETLHFAKIASKELKVDNKVSGDNLIDEGFKPRTLKGKFGKFLKWCHITTIENPNFSKNDIIDMLFLILVDGEDAIMDDLKDWEI